MSEGSARSVKGSPVSMFASDGEVLVLSLVCMIFFPHHHRHHNYLPLNAAAPVRMFGTLPTTQNHLILETISFHLLK